jgi:hypothetical protein
MCWLITDPNSSAKEEKRSVAKPVGFSKEIRDALPPFSSELLSSYGLPEERKD